MRYTFLLLITTLVFLSCGQNNNKKNEVAQKKETIRDSLTPATTSSQTDISQANEKIVSEIDSAVNRIKSLSLTKKTFKLKETDCDVEDVAINYFLDKNEILKISTTFFVPDAEGGVIVTRTYYFKNNKFIFSHEDWKSQGGDGPPKGTVGKYAHDDQIIRRMENDSIIKEDPEIIDADSEEYRILDAYSNKKFAAVFCD